ncbi:hypothetical protein ACFU99_03595 [Streptomyces sp. NPDC057654]|uniref:hypothetical protein n=1 Tax=Streptomyces sp. NPDC057654 TaxID=3346196 RepID=UPI0036BF9939
MSDRIPGGGGSHSHSGGSSGSQGSDGQKLRAKLEKLKGFQSRVDDILADLSNSAASPDHIARDKLSASHLGSYDFVEAMSLYGAYYEVHSQLETLSKLLADQIEAMGTAVQSARVSYGNIDLEQRARMWEIQNDLKRHYRPDAPTDTSGGQAAGS